jgi:hypothetical protein
LTLAVFAKSYAFELAGLAIAMVCWQSARDGRGGWWNVLGVWFGLVLAIYSHSFAIFLFVPFAMAQGLQDYRRKRADWPMWAALALFPAALLPVLRGALLASKLYGANFWSKPSAALLKQTYIDYFVENWRFLLILFVASLIATVLLKERARTADSAGPEAQGFSVPEWGFVVMLAALPLYVFPASYLLHAYRADYVVSFAVGLALLLVALFAEHAQRTQGAGVVLLLFFAFVTLRVDLKTIPQGLRAMAHPTQVHAELAAGYDSQPWVKLLEASDLPVLVGDHLLYTRLECYAPPELRRRIYFPTDFAEVKDYPLSETSQRNFLLFGKLLSYQTMDIGSFLPEHPHFLLALQVSTGTLWLAPYLMHQEQHGNVSLRLLGPDFAMPNVYDVQFTRMPEFPKEPPLIR